MKINNETKIGIIAVAALILLFFGFSYLKGRNIFHKENKLYAVYRDVMGLKVSNPVVINGLQVGHITNIDGGRDMRKLLVTLALTRDVNIPDNSIAIINPNLLSSPTIEIQLGNSNTFKRNGDTLMTGTGVGAIDEALRVLNPVLYEVRKSVASLDSVFKVISTTFDNDTKVHIRSMLKNLDVVSQSFTVSAKSLETMMDPHTGSIGQSMTNINSFTRNLSDNGQNMDTIVSNMKTISDHLTKLNLEQTLNELNTSLNNLKGVTESLNSKDGSLGMLVNDKGLYQNLESTTRKLNTLLDDMRVHPRRYLNISVFGKKDKGNFLIEPLPNDPAKQ